LKNFIPYSCQDINGADIQAVVDILKSDFLTQGPVVPIFENAVMSYCGANYAVAVNSATSALHIACLALEVSPGDIVWTSPITFVATANCALYCGAKIDFVDINPLTYNISVEQLTKKLALAQKNGTLPKVLIPVHLSGQSCEMAEIYELSKKYGFKIIEDASHAIGGKYKNEFIGNCRYSDITIFSFHPVKIITTGEGGIALTNDLNIAKRMRLFRSHGITNLPEDMREDYPTQEIWNYQQITLGFNYRMTDIQAALGLSQMNRLSEFVAKRHSIAKRYNDSLVEMPITIPYQQPETYSSYHLYIIRLKLAEINKSHRQIYDAFYESKICVNLHYIPVYRHPYYKKIGFTSGYCQEAEKYYSEAISIPLYPRMNEGLQDKVISVIKDVTK